MSTVLAAGLATINVLKKPRAYNHINWIAEKVKKCMRDSFEEKKIDGQVIGLASMFQCLFTSNKNVKNYRDVAKADSEKRAKFDLELINNGVYVRPCRTYYTSLAHTKADLDKTFEAIEKATDAIGAD